MLTADHYRQSARRLQALFARVDGPAAAADAIIELAAGDRAGTGPRPSAPGVARARDSRVLQAKR
jgi:hypothetical protein